MGLREAIVLLVLPFVTCVVGLALSVSQGAGFLFISNAMNSPNGESWPLFFLRYGLWHATFFGISHFKLGVYPRQLRWVGWLNLVVYLFTIWTGLTQWDPEGYRLSWREYMHLTGAATCLVMWTTETVSLWTTKL